MNGAELHEFILWAKSLKDKKMRTYEQLKKAILQKGHIWFDGQVNANFIWERTSDDITNKFTDFLHVCYSDVNKNNHILTIPATTKAGIKGAIDSPVTVEGVTGTAIIIPNQYHNAWQFKDTTAEFSHNPYFRQIGKIDYWRDGNKDLKVDKVNEQDDKVFGTHWHVMSNKPPAFQSGNVNNWSLGCMGAQYDDWHKVIDLTRNFVKISGDLFTGTIIESKDII